MFKVTIWGSRGSIPVSGQEFSRHGGATTCLEVALDSSSGDTPKRVLIDCGSGLAELGKRWGDRSPDALILQTHMHWDHIQGFPFFGPFFNPNASFDCWAVMREGSSLQEVLSQQMRRPTFPIGLDFLPAQLSYRNLSKQGSAQLGDLLIEWTEVDHPSGSTAYRLSYQGTSLVFTGDVETQQGCREKVIDFAKGSDLLIMDSQYFPDEYEARKGFGHSTPEDAVDVAISAGVDRLLLTHHDPRHNDELLDSKLEIARNRASNKLQVGNAYDGLHFACG